jgi:hypothetical protein
VSNFGGSDNPCSGNIHNTNGSDYVPENQSISRRGLRQINPGFGLRARQHMLHPRLDAARGAMT